MLQVEAGDGTSKDGANLLARFTKHWQSQSHTLTSATLPKVQVSQICEIDYISEVVAELAPQWPKMEDRFNEENKAFKTLLAQDHDLIGRVLKCHLIIENYVNRHLQSVSPSHNWQNAKLAFAQKITLLPQRNAKVAWILPGIREINAIRNRFGHQIQAKVSLNDLTKCRSVLAIARRGKDYEDPIEIIEDFTAIVCTWLIVDPEIERVFAEAFGRARGKHNIQEM